MRLIDADALIAETIERYCKNCDKRKGIKNGKWKIVYQIGDAPCRACAVDDMKCDIEDAPTIEPERKKGRWIYSAGTSGSDTTTALKFFPTCSECGTEHFTTNFCPNCGADMREDKE